MENTILITGGARSGKSVFAETQTLARRHPTDTPAIYIATAEAHDGEMAKRIAEHQDRRGAEWRTHNAPRDLVGALVATDGAGPRLVDCLTLWLTNLMLADEDWDGALRALCAALPAQQSPVIFVTNEVGSGIVPESKLGRAFRDAQGRVNQAVAEASDALYLVVAGQPLRIK